MVDLTSKQIEQAKARGAEITVIPKIIEVPGLESLVDQLRDMIASNSRSYAVVLAALSELTDTIKGKKLQGTDVSKIVVAIEDLKSCYEAPCFPDYIIDFERDQRSLMKTGIRLRVVRDGE